MFYFNLKKFNFYIFFFVFFFFLIPTKNIFGLDSKHLQEIENYLNKLKFISSEFIQSSSDGYQAEGKIFLSKPGKLRIEYKEKENLLIIADGKWLHYYDIELNEIQSVIIEKSPAWFLLKKKLNFKKDFNIKQFKKNSGKTTISLTNDKLENVKKITLIFASKPIELKKWIILDFQDIETTVSLLNIKEEKSFNKKTFSLIK